MEISGIPPGRTIGWTLHALFDEVLDEPEKNTALYLEQRAKDLLALPSDELERLGEEGREKKSEKEEEEVSAIRKKYNVK